MAMETLFSWGPANVSSLIATTQANRDIKEVQDAVFNQLILLDHLSKKGKVRTGGGGTSVIVPIRQAKNTTAGSYSNYGTINTQAQDELTAAQFKYKQYGASVTISGKEDRVQNKGKYEVLDLVKTKIEGAEASLRDKLNTDMFATAPASQDVGSLYTSIDATSSIGEINSTTYSFWQSKVVTSGSFSAQGLADMRTTWGTLAQRMPKSPTDLILTDLTTHTYYEGSQQPQLRYEKPDTANGGFADLMFKSAPIKYDAQATSGTMYFLNSDVMELVIDPDTNFIMTPFQQPIGQDAKTALYLVALELVIKNRRKLGRMNSITA